MALTNLGGSMTNRLFSIALLAAVGALLIAGCGSSSSSSSTPSGSSGSSSAAAPAAPTATPTSAGGASPSSGGAAPSPNLAAGVARCKASVAAASTLSADAKSKLQGLCDQAAKGDPTQLRKATAQVCQQIVKESVPASAQQQALATCPKP